LHSNRKVEYGSATLEVDGRAPASPSVNCISTAFKRWCSKRIRSINQIVWRIVGIVWFNENPERRLVITIKITIRFIGDSEGEWSQRIREGDGTIQIITWISQKWKSEGIARMWS